MKNNYSAKFFSKTTLLSIISLFSIINANAQSFTNGNLAVFVANSSSVNNTTGKLVEINTSTANQTAINNFNIDGTTGANSLRFSGSATSTGYLTNSNDGSLVCFTGGNTINTSSNINTITSRGVGTFNNAGTYNLATTYTGTSGNQTRSATSINNTDWFIGDQGGIYTNGTTTASPTGNIRSVKSFGGTAYTFSASASIPPVGTIATTTGGTVTALPGLANGATTRTDFYLISSGTNGTSYDVLYISDATSATVGAIYKYSLVSGTWTANGSYTTNFGGFGIAAQSTTNSAALYVSSGTGATAANSVIKLVDAAGYNTTINITTANNITLYTAAAGTTIKGVAFAPIGCTAPTQPAAFTAGSTTVIAGTNNVTYTVPNDALVTYNWTYSGTGVNISGTGNSVTLSFSAAATSGTLSVTATNACSTSAATAISITVAPLNDFTNGNLVVFKTIGIVSKASSAITLNEYTTSGATGISVTLPTSGSTPIQSAGVYGGSEGFLTTSNDQKFLVVGGYGTSTNFTDITGTPAISTPRVVGRITPSGAYSQVASSNTFFSANDIRGAISDGSNFWAGGASNANIDGIDYFGPGPQTGLGAGTVPPKAYSTRIFNGQIYYSTQKAGPTNTTSQLGIFSLGTGMPTSGTQTATQIINTGTIIPQDFSFNSTSDICYIAISLNNASGGIQKWTKSGSVWTLAYTIGTGASNIGAYGLVVDYAGVNPIIYATTFESTGNRIIKITDTGAASIATDIVTATAGTFYKGITFAPVDGVTPIVDLSINTNTASEAGSTVVTVTANASSTLLSNQTITLSVSGTSITAGDYNLSNTTITIPAGSSSGSVTFTIIDDAVEEGNETAVLTISNPSAGIALGFITSQNILISDNDNYAPTIVMDIASTSNYIDGGVLVAPASPFGTSGVVGDVTDPSSTLGIYFTIDDIGNPVNSLTVTANSSNTSVVPNANLVLTGTGAQRKINITPIAVGYSNITIAVSDGLNTTNYIINYAASDSVPQILPANTFQHTGMSDASNGMALDENYFITADDELDIINVYSLNASGLPVKSFDYSSFLNLPDPVKPEVDVEALTKSTSVNGRVYFSGSMSNGKAPFDNKPNRDRLFATTITGTGAATAFSVVGYCDIKAPILAWGDANGYNFSASAAAGVDSKGINGFATEGMVFGPDNTTLYIGLRAPLVPTANRTKAVIVPVLNFETWFNNGSPSGNPTFGSPIELNLGGRGIRDIIKLADGNYIIVAGSYGTTLNGTIYKWNGNANSAPVLVSVPSSVAQLNMEGAMEVVESSIPSLSKIHVIGDGGGSILYNDATEAKDFANLNLRKFRSDLLTNIDINLCSGATASISTSNATTFCAGDSITLSANSAASYLWSNGKTTQSIVVHAAGSYSVTTTDINGCAKTSSNTNVTVNALPTATILAGGATTFCSGDSVTLTANTASAYLWSNNATTQSIVVHTGGNYNVAITDANGCSKTSSNTNVTVNALPTVSISSNGATTFCTGDSVTLTASAASSYLWSNNATTQSITAHNAGNYSVEITDANGCSKTSSNTNIIVNTLPTASISSNGATTFCSGDSVTLTANVANSYLWSNAATTQSIVVSNAGNYNVAITDANGCKNTSSNISVAVNALPTATIVANGSTSICNGNFVTLNSSSNNDSYQWLLNGMPISNATNNSINSYVGGNYTLEVSNAALCKDTSNVITVIVINVPSSVIIANSATTFCAGNSVTLNEINTVDAYQWLLNGLPINNTTNTLIANTSGSYSLEATNGSICKDTSNIISVTVVDMPLAAITANGATTICSGNNVTLNASNSADSYQWLLNGSPISSETNNAISVNTNGSYSLEVTNASLCKDTSNAMVINVVNMPTAVISGTVSFCNGDSTILTASNNADAYQWMNNNSIINGAINSTLTVHAAGNYSLIATNNSLCSDTSNAISTIVNTPIIATITQSNDTLYATTGLASYQWYLNNVAISGANMFNLLVTQDGDYTVETADNNICSSTSSTFTVITTNLNNVENNISASLYPNPTSNLTTVGFSLTSKQNVTLSVFDITGKLVMDLLNEKQMDEGLNKINLDASNLSNGIYFIMLKAGTYNKTMKLIVNK